MMPPESWVRTFMTREAWLRTLTLEPDLRTAGGYGERYSVALQLSKEPPKRVYYVAFEPGGLPTDGIHAAELPHKYVEVDTTVLQIAAIIDRSGKKIISLKDLLPEGWELKCVDLSPDLAKKLKAERGIDITTGDGQAWASTQLTLQANKEERAVLIPPYKMSRQGQRVDEFAEQIIYTIGLAHAIVEGKTAFHDAHRFAKDYTSRTLGGDLLQDR